ncbi:MAG: sugar ABC transporter substrate-binding protein [Desulfurococcales archaeon]|nr:sugar ABC transporter substrate-binding protein [Desulfurococcales archaeon]
MKSLKKINAVLIGGPGFEPYQTLYRIAIPAFEREYRVKVNILGLYPHPELNRIKDTLNGKEDIDVISSHTSFLRSYSHLYEDLSPYLGDLYQDLLDPLKKSCEVDGKILLMPRFIDVRSLHYRKDLIQAPPKTWDELVEIAKRVNNPPRIYGFAMVGYGHALVGSFMEILHSFGGRIADEENGECLFASSEGVDALSYIVDLYRRHRVTPPETPEMFYNHVSEVFSTGRVAMIFEWPGWDGLHNDPKRSKISGLFDLDLYPVGKSGRYVYGGSHGFSIFKGSKNPELAAELIRFLVSIENQVAEAEAEGFLPSRKSSWDLLVRRARDRGDMFQIKRLEIYRRTIDESYLPVRIKNWRRFTEIVWPELNVTLRGHKSPREALEYAKKKVVRVIGGCW